MSNAEKPIYSPVVIDFITAAVQYCMTLEQVDAATARRPFLERIARLLPLVYVKATLLPAAETVGDDPLPEAVTEEDYEAVRAAVSTLLGEGDSYLEVFTPDMPYSDGPIAASVAEQLADIYQDLKNFAAVYADSNEVTMNNALVHVQETFALYWGQKLVNALRPIHELLYGRHDDEEDDDDCHCDDDDHCDCDHHHDHCDCHHDHDSH